MALAACPTQELDDLRQHRQRYSRLLREFGREAQRFDEPGDRRLGPGELPVADAPQGPSDMVLAAQPEVSTS